MRKEHRFLIAILGGLTAIGPLSIDMYLPAFPAIAESLGTSIARVGLSLTSYFIGISFGQVVYGPLLDRYGRKKPILAGLALYIAASVACGLSSSMDWLILNRVFLALGGCVGMVGGRAVVRDLFHPDETARVFSALMLFMGVAPIIAPTIGGLISSAIGWRWIFAVLALIAAAAFAAVAFLIPESKAPDRSVSLRPHRVAREYLAILRERQFLVYAGASGAVSAALFAYISGAPFVLMGLFGLSERQFGFVFGLNAMGLITGSQINRLLLRKYSSANIVAVVAGLQLATGAVLLFGALLGVAHAMATLIAVFGFLFFLGFLNPNTTALALRPFSRNAGSASALLGSIQMLSGASSSALVSFLHNGTALPMTGAMALCALLGLTLVSAHGLRAPNALPVPRD